MGRNAGQNSKLKITAQVIRFIVPGSHLGILKRTSATAAERLVPLAGVAGKLFLFIYLADIDFSFLFKIQSVAATFR
jgi:hypothetical protein